MVRHSAARRTPLSGKERTAATGPSTETERVEIGEKNLAHGVFVCESNTFARKRIRPVSPRVPGNVRPLLRLCFSIFSCGCKQPKSIHAQSAGKVTCFF